MSATPAVRLHDAFRIYDSPAGGVAALRGLNLTVEPGEVVVVLGPSGSGKSTLLRVLAGADRLSAGHASVLGLDLGRASHTQILAHHAHELGVLDQHYARSLSVDLTCRQTVSLQLGLLGHDPREASRAATRLLDDVGLADRADELPGALSGGEQQRVAVCAALAHGPRLLLADEPAGELDAENAAVVYRLLGELLRRADGTGVIVSHDPSAAEIADRLLYVQDGRIVEEERPGGSRALVVAGGWIRLPDSLLRAVGAPTLAAARQRGDEVVLSAVSTASNRPIDAEVPRARASATPAVACVRDVTKRYRNTLVLDGFSREFASGLFTVVVGPSGSGKTTLLHMLAGLERPSTGEVEIAGSALQILTRSQRAELRRRSIALVTQEPGLVPFLTALENVQLGLRIRGSGPERAQSALAEVGLETRLELPVARLSAGERQRVALARALAADVPLLLVDEPTARLDRESSLLVARLLARAARQHRLAVVCATHDPALIEAADEVVPLRFAVERTQRARVSSEAAYR